VIVGVDPGQTGGLAWLSDDGATLFHVEDMPVVDTAVSPQLLTFRLRVGVGFAPDEPLTAVVEQVASMPGQGVASMFKFGTSFGIVLGVLAGHDVPTELVRPHVWKRDLRLAKGKGASRGLAQRLWPEQAGLFGRVKDDGRAEAALLARWGVEHSRMVTR
jgi:crossover junction endodeoxyribonuclease RuvC